MAGPSLIVQLGLAGIAGLAGYLVIAVSPQQRGQLRTMVRARLRIMD